MFNPHFIYGQTNQDIRQFSLNDLLTAVNQHKLIILRHFAALTREELLQFLQTQAQLLAWDFGPVMEMRVDAHPKNYLFTNGDVPLHWDGAFYQEPRFLVFHCLKAPAMHTGGETIFVNTEMVWKNLDFKMQAKWSTYQLQFTTEKLAHYGGQITCQLVNKYPDNDHVFLRFAEPVGENYLNPVHVKILDQDPEQSSQILQEMSQFMRQPEFSYSHQWQPGDYLIADNFALLHGRNAFKQHSPRHLRRIQIL